MLSQPVVSVVIPVWNGEAEIGRCLAALGEQTLDRSAFEVVVVDNGSTDRTPDIVRGFADVVLLHEPVAGSYRARNRGVAVARGTYVAFTDADCIPDPGWLAAGLAHARAGAGIVAGDIALFRLDPRDSPTCEAYERIFSLNQRNYVKQGAAVTANWFSPRAAVLGVGGFDAELKSSGDWEMASRMIAAGHTIVFAADAVVSHPIRGRISDLVKKRVRLLGGQWTRQKRTSTRRRFAYAAIRDLWQQAKLVWRSTHLSGSQKVRVCLLIGLMGGAVALELTRLYAGGEPRRA